MNDSLTDIVEFFENQVEQPDSTPKTRNKKRSTQLFKLQNSSSKSTEEIAVKPSGWVISEESVFKRWWDIWILINVLFIAIVTPFRLAFDENDSVTWKVINWFTDCFFLIDLVLSFFESYYDEENNIHVTSLKKIAKNYLKGWFTIDFISIIPFESILKSFVRYQ